MIRWSVVAVFLSLSVSGHGDSISDAAAKVNRDIDIVGGRIEARLEIEKEFMAMSHELAMLHDPKVSKIMLPHVNRISRILERTR